MTERVDFLYIRKSVIETFNQCWTFYETEQVGGQASSTTSAALPLAGTTSSGSASAPAAASAIVLAPAGGAKPAPVGKGKGAKRGAEAAKSTEAGSPSKKTKTAKEDKTPGSGQKTTEKSEMNKLMGQAGKVKVKYLAVTGAATTLLQTIATDKKWKWASNGAMMKPLQDAMTELNNHTCDFSRMFVSEEVARVKKSYDDKTLFKNLELFKTNFAKCTEVVELEAQQLVRMHSGRKL
jgi:hypothetical protein